MRILITGSSGTIGTRLFEYLSPQHEVVGTDVIQNKWNPELNAHSIRLDLRKSEALNSLPKDFDLVIHLAANARVYELVKDPQRALDNILINFNILEFLRKNSIGKIIFASSRETYGNIMGEKAITEDMVRLENCESPYSASKVTGEALIHAYSKVYGIDFVIVRFSNVYGMYDDSDRVIPLWLRQCLNNEDIIVYGKEKVLDFTYIDDAVTAVTRIVDRFNQVKGNTFNIASGKGVNLLSIARQIKELLKASSNIIEDDNRPGEVWKFEADISRARRLLDYEPRTGIEEGLEKTVAWYEKHISYGER